MIDTPAQLWEALIGRATGPLTFRLVLQPAIAVLAATRAGLADARLGRPPFLRTVATSPELRKQLLKQAWADTSRLFVVATVIDAVYQLIVYRWVYIVQALIVATVLAVVPYVAVRGPISRCVRLIRRRRHAPAL